MRVCFPQLPHTTITLETLMAASFSTMPPLMFFCGFGRVWRFTIATCSTTAICFCVDRQHAPALACVASGDHAYLVALANLDGVAYRSLMSQSDCHCLPNLRSQRNDLGELLFAQLSGHRAEHARAHRLVRVVDQHRGIVVEADVSAVFTAALLAHPHDDCFYH